MTYPGTIVHLVPGHPGRKVTVTETGPGVWEISMKIDGVLWTSWQWGAEKRDTAERLARQLVKATP